MAAIIAQLSYANRQRQKRRTKAVPPDKSIYELKPFDERFIPDVHNKYLRCQRLRKEREQLEKLRFIHEVAAKAGKNCLDDRLLILHENVQKVRRKKRKGIVPNRKRDFYDCLLVFTAGIVFLGFFILLFLLLFYTFCAVFT